MLRPIATLHEIKFFVGKGNIQYDVKQTDK